MNPTVMLQEFAQQLSAANIPLEVVGNFSEVRSLRTLFRKQLRFHTVANCWRLGSLLLTPAGELYSSEGGVRAAKRERLGYVADTQELRRDLAGYAFLSGVPAGTQANYGGEKLEIDSIEKLKFPLAYSNGELKVLWTQHVLPADAPSLADYLRDCVTARISTANR